MSASAVRDAGVAYLLISLALVVAPASALIEAALPFLFLACHVCLFLMTSHAATVALRLGRPLARARLLGTVVAQLLHVVFLVVPSIASSPLVLFALALVGTVMTTAGAQDEEEKRPPVEKKTEREKKTEVAAPPPKDDKGKEEMDEPMPPLSASEVEKKRAAEAEAEQKQQEEEKKKKEEAGTRVSLGVAAAFLLVAAVGLNGEQILDASFKVSSSFLLV